MQNKRYPKTTTNVHMNNGGRILKPSEVKENHEKRFSRLISKERHQEDQEEEEETSALHEIIKSKSTSPSPCPSPSIAGGIPSSAEASFRVYYGATGNVPFLWESRPGTPKHTSHESYIPPLTPPPSYSYSKSKDQFTLARRSASAQKGKLKPSSIISSMISLPKVLPKRNNSCSCGSGSGTQTTSTPSSSASMNSFSSSSSSTSTGTSRRRRFSSPLFSRRKRNGSGRQLFGDDMHNDDHHHQGRHDIVGSLNSTLCFGGGCSRIHYFGKNGCYAVKNMTKNAFSSIVGGHRSSNRVIYMA